MVKKRRTIKSSSSVIIILATLIILEIVHSQYGIETTHYEINSICFRGKENLRVTHLSDLHDVRFGKNIKKLISMVSVENPDLIFITGDLVDSHTIKDTVLAEQVISQLVKIAPVYVSLGNQEKDLMERYSYDVVGKYERAGAVVLDFSYVDIEINGYQYRIGGIYGYCQPMAYTKETHRESEAEFLMDFQDTDAFKLLLCHMPVCWENSYSLYDWDVDVVFSGHVHGGQVRIPFVGGLWAPDYGWFPGSLSGVYTTSRDGWEKSREKLQEYINYMKYDISYYEEHIDYYPSYLVLSRGLGNTDWVPRFNNAPEIVVVDLAPSETLSENN